ncbi:exported hypothetical protein [groundwater metagenome]|uniref:CARDB domain-containing protein n=1 Tax=groundwater metagenome TaxID=717931 RepID=A0A098E9Y7_9ZZZZ
MEPGRKILSVLTAAIVVFLGMSIMLNIGAESSVNVYGNNINNINNVNNINNINLYPASVFVGDSNVIMLFNSILLQAFPGYAMQTNVDVSVTSISYYSSTQLGCKQKVNVSINYANLGDVETNGRIYLIVDGVNLIAFSGASSLFNLDSGDSGSVILVTNLLGVGNHIIKAVIEVEGSTDLNLSNNEKSMNYIVPSNLSADVSVALLSGELFYDGACILPPPGQTCPADWDCWQNLKIHSTINNTGCGNATGVEVRYYVDGILVDNQTINVEYGTNAIPTGIWNLQDGKVKPLKGNHEIKVVTIYNGVNKTVTTSKITCEKPNTTTITETNQVIQFGTQCKNLNISQNAPIQAASGCNTSIVSAKFSDFNYSSNIITKGNFSCTNCDNLNISENEIKNLTLNASIPDVQVGLYEGKINVTYVCDDAIGMTYIFLYNGTLNVSSPIDNDYRNNLSYAVNFSQYQGKNTTNSFENPNIASYNITNITVEFTDYYNDYNNSQIIGKGNLTCLNCDSVVPISAGTQKEINLSVNISIDASPGNYTGNITITYTTNSLLCPIIYEKRSSRIEVLSIVQPTQDLRNNSNYTISFGVQYQGLNRTISMNTTSMNCSITNITLEFTDYYNNSNIITKGNFTYTPPALPYDGNEIKQINLTAHYPDNAALMTYRGNITIKYYCYKILEDQLFIYPFIYGSNLTVLNKTQLHDYSNDSAWTISFGERCPGQSVTTNISTINSSSTDGSNITNIIIEFTDYYNNVNNTIIITKGNFTHLNPSLPIAQESRLINLTANFPTDAVPGQYSGNISVSYYVADGRMFKYMFPSNLTVSYVLPIIYNCNINTTGYCIGTWEFDPTVDGSSTTIKFEFNASEYSWRNINFSFSDLYCNSTTTCNGATIQANNIVCDENQILFPNIENITCTLNISQNTKPGNYSGKLNLSKVWNSSCPQKEEWKNINIKVTVINATISVPPGPNINYGNVTGRMNLLANLTIPNNQNYSITIDGCTFTNLTTSNGSVITSTNISCTISGGNDIPANSNKTIYLVLDVPDNQTIGNYIGQYGLKLIFNDPNVAWKWRGNLIGNISANVIETPTITINPSEIDFGNLTAGTSNNGESYIELDQPCTSILNQNVSVEFTDIIASGGKKIGKEQITANVNLVTINSTHCNVTFAVALNVLDPQDTGNYTGTYTYSLRINDDYKTKVTGTADTKVQIISTPVTVINPSEIDFGNLTAGTSNNGESYIELDQPCTSILNQNVSVEFADLIATGGKKIGKEQITANVNLVTINSTHCNVTFVVALNVLDPQDTGNYTGTYTYSLRINDDYKTKVTGTADTKVQIISTPVTVINPSEIDFRKSDGRNK